MIYTVKLNFLPKTNINNAINEAIKVSKLLKQDVRFDFNGVRLFVADFKNASEVYAYYHEHVEN